MVYTLLCGTSSIPIGGYVIAILFIMPLGYGFTIDFLHFVRGKDETSMIGDMFKVFNNYGRSLGIAFMVFLYTLLWSLLFFIPGIIKSYSYAMTYFLSQDHPEWSIDECITASMKMMDGKKGKLFLLNLSFIGWMLLGILSLGIGFLWIIPYMNTSTTMFYENLLEESSIEGK